MKYLPAETCIRARIYQLTRTYSYQVLLLIRLRKTRAKSIKTNTTHILRTATHTKLDLCQYRFPKPRTSYPRIRSRLLPPKAPSTKNAESRKAKVTYQWIDRRTYVARKPGLDLPLKIITSTPGYPSSRTGVGFLRTSMEYLRVHGG